MGTRGLTFIHSEWGSNEPILCMYRQYDSYPEVHGKELADFLRHKEMVNGIPVDDRNNKNMANGMSCLAAQMVANFKKEVGGIYINPIDSENQDYTYHIYIDKIVVFSWENQIFEGTWQEFFDWIEEQ